MPIILIAWELGSGLGHVGPLRAVGGELARRGHAVSIAAPNVELCRQAFAGTEVKTLPAPVLPLSIKRLKFPCTYSDTLHDCGYSSADDLTAAVGEWLRLFDAFAPDLLLADHSPTALLAARMRAFAVATIGPGFVCPPDISPLPSLRREIPEPHWTAEVEQTVLTSMNTALAAYGAPALERVTEIFGTAERQYLLTFPELDHYRDWREQDPRRDGYWSPIGTLPGQVCDWPSGPGILAGPQVFVYLRDNAVLLPILRGLAYNRYPTIGYGPHASEADEASFEGTSVRLSRTPVDLNMIGRECSLVVLHGGHGTVCDFVRKGVALLLLPLTLEQRIVGERLTELGVGAYAPREDMGAIAEKLEQILADSQYRSSAQQFALRLPKSDEQADLARLIDDLENLVAPVRRGQLNRRLIR